VNRNFATFDDFAPEAEALRKHFDERFADPRKADGGRFVWDWWNVPGQYTALRTPAWEYFPKDVYESFHKRLVAWGRRTLGCHDVSPPWMSCYIDGCSQQLHGDLPHGPWAFVFSLTKWKTRAFRGGETLMLRDDVLDFWSDFVSERSVEEPDVLRAIEPRFNRLTVFDPRIPHGVREVSGTKDPREGRLVIHGWFVQPRPLVDGPLPGAQLRRRVDDMSGALAPWLNGDLPVSGLLSVGFRVTVTGEVTEVTVLSDTTRVARSEERNRKRFVAAVLKLVRAMTFPKQKAPSWVTLPMVFEREA
jgi:2OG-Fe(II) oxygenase superfamily